MSLFVCVQGNLQSSMAFSRLFPDIKEEPGQSPIIHPRYGTFLPSIPLFQDFNRITQVHMIKWAKFHRCPIGFFDLDLQALTLETIQDTLATV